METFFIINVSIVLSFEIMEAQEKIVSAAIELFLQYGFKTITMDDIARKAGISKKTLYQHFSNKADVVKETVSSYKNKVAESCNMHLTEAANAVEGMVRVVALFDKINRNINPLTLFEMERYFPECHKMFVASFDEEVKRIKNNLKRGIEEGYYREDINIEFMATYRMELSLLVFHPSLLVRDKFPMYVIGNEISEHYLYGIMTAKGEKLYKKYKEQYLKHVSKI